MNYLDELKNRNSQIREIQKAKISNQFTNTDDGFIIEKGHKYFKKEPDGKGGWKYYYTEAEYKEAKGSEEEKEGDSKNNSFDWNSKDAEILKKYGITKNNLKVGGGLDLRGTKITSLPKNLIVGRNLYLNETKITSLPDNLTVGRNLYLRETKITSLPNNLRVGGDLCLRETNITSLPDTLIVGRDLDLRETKITKSDFKDTMKIKGKIFLDKPQTKPKFNFE